MRSPFLPLLRLLVAVGLALPAMAAEPFLRPHDVIALVGGEDMVAASEYGYLELLLTRALPGYQLRFRNLAWEGDTVFEQRRDLNFPTWEEQLEKIGATVVICQFGQMESLAGKEKWPALLEAYRVLVDRFRAGGKRRILLLSPGSFSDDLRQVRGMGELEMKISKIGDRTVFIGSRMPDHPTLPAPRRDGVHLSAAGHTRLANYLAQDILAQAISHGPGLNTEVRAPKLVKLPERGGPLTDSQDEALRQLIIRKNRLWFDYWRPQNWAFLAGDRTAQPSSRDHLDPSKRWFPPEREAFLPLIEAKEKEIDALAAKLGGAQK